MSEGQWRYIAQRMDGAGGFGQFLDFNVPLMGSSIEDVLSGHNSLSGTIAPEYARLKTVDGMPLLVEWGTALWAESPDGEIRGGGILTHSSFVESSWSVEFTDLTAIADDLPYTEANWWVNQDPLDIWRYIWRYIQSQPGGNLGITVDPTTSPVRVGSDLVEFVEFDLEVDPSAEEPPPEEEAVPLPVAPNRYANNADWRDAAVKAMKAVGWTASVVDDALKKWLNKDAAIAAGTWKQLTDKERNIKTKAIEKVGYPPNPPSGTHPAPITKVIYQPDLLPIENIDPTVPPGPEGPTYQYEAYKLNWYTNHDLSATIDDLASSTPFDWHMTHRWNGDEIAHHIRVGYPKLGRRRTDARFVVGENIHIVPTVERDGTEYANEVLVLGAGEGSLMIMARAFHASDGRIRKVATISDPSLTTQAAAAERANQELARRANLDDITDIVLQDHPHAPPGSIDLGDEILIEGETGWIDLEVWCRVVARTISPDSGEAMTLTLIRSDRLA